MTLSSQPLGLVIFSNVVLCVRHNLYLKHKIMRPTQIQTLRKNLGPQNPDLRKKTS